VHHIPCHFCDTIQLQLFPQSRILTFTRLVKKLTALYGNLTLATVYTSHGSEWSYSLLKLNFKHKQHTTSHSLRWPAGRQQVSWPNTCTANRLPSTTNMTTWVCQKCLHQWQQTETQECEVYKQKLFGLPTANPFFVSPTFTFGSIKWYVTSRVDGGLNPHKLTYVLLWILNWFPHPGCLIRLAMKA
jgi:hypothetical protein